MSEIQLVGHRGLMARYPENTLASLRAALDAGADWVEFDVQMNADGQLYLMHDASLARTTGYQETIFGCQHEQLDKLSAGYSERFGGAFEGEAIATLQQALSLVADYPNSRALVEIKSESLQHFGHDNVMPNLLETLARFGSQCRMISFDAAAVAYTLQASQVECGWVMHWVNQATLALAEKLAVPMLACDYLDLPEGLVPTTGVEWMVYDVQDAAIARSLQDRGVALIESADVESLRAALRV